MSHDDDDNNDDWDDAADRDEALAEGWYLVAQVREAMVLFSEAARRLADWRYEYPAAAKKIPFQEVERLAREWEE